MLPLIWNCTCCILKNKPFGILRLFPARNLSIARYGLSAGHSKWANIRHIKAAKDEQKSNLFTKLSRQIRLAIQDGGNADPSLNGQLKSVIEEALRSNMPMTTIQKNIQKCKEKKVELKRYKLDLRYKKVFAICIIYSDNYAAVKMEIATILRKFCATIVDANHMFKEIGLVEAVINKSQQQQNNDIEDAVTEDAIICGAEEVEIIDTKNGIVNFFCRPSELFHVRKNIEDHGYVTINTEHIYIPLNVVELLPEESKDYQKFITKLREVSGIEEIYDNVNDI